jgi:hypothetical protein
MSAQPNQPRVSIMGRVERAVVEVLVRAVDSGASFEADLAAVARATGGVGRAAE